MEATSRIESKCITNAPTPGSVGLDVVLVYGVTLSDIPVEASKWPSTLPSLLPDNSSLTTFDLRTHVNDAFMMPTFMEMDRDLLNKLHQLFLRRSEPLRPIVICTLHCAGILVKRMLRLASDSLHQYRDLLRAISGLVFLATPHITQDTKTNNGAAEMLALILRIELGKKKRSPSALLNVICLKHVSQHFALLKLRVPVLSCYETTPIRVRWPITRKFKDYQMVHQKLATTEIRGEKPTGIDIELPKIFEDSNSMLANDIANFFKDVNRDAPSRIQKVIALQSPSRPLSRERSIVSSAFEELSLGGSATNSVPSTPSRKTRSSIPCSPQSNVVSEPSYEFVSTGPRNFPKCQTIDISLPIYRPRDEFVSNPDFEGRRDVLSQISEALAPLSPDPSSQASQIVRAFAICGPGGIGKTQTARQYALSSKGQFDAIFWLHAGEKDALSRDFLRIAVYLGFEQNGQATDPIISKDHIKSWLSNPRYVDTACGVRLAKWLLIFDNADDPGLLTEFWPREGQGSVLVTSRNEIALATLYFGASGTNLGILSLEEATRLSKKIFSRMPSGSSQEQDAKVAAKLHCFPLAIVQMAGVCLLRGWSPDDFLKRYDNEMERHKLHHQHTPLSHGYLKTLASIWALHTFNERPKNILFLLALLDPDNIREDILTTEPALAKLHGLPTDIIDLKEVLTPLRQASIVVYKFEGILSIHRFVQDVIKAEITGIQGFAPTIVLATARLVSSVWPYARNQGGAHPQYQQTERWSQCESLYLHVHRLCEVYRTLAEEDQTLCATADLIDLVNEAAWYHFETMRTVECLLLVDVAFQLCGQAGEDVQSHLADTHNVVQSMASRSNDTEKCYLHAAAQFEIREKLAGQSGSIETHAMAVSCSELAKASIDMDLLQTAEELFSRSKKIRENLPEYVPTANFNPILGLGCVYHLRGECNEAASTFEKVLQDREAFLGPNDVKGPRTGHALYWLGKARACQGRHEESFSFFLRAKIHFRKTIGKDHPSTAPTYYKLVSHSMTLGDYEEASLLLDQTVNIYSKGANHGPHLARCQFKRGELLIKKGNMTGALAALDLAAQMRHKICPHDPRQAGELRESDYDDLIDYWAR